MATIVRVERPKRKHTRAHEREVWALTESIGLGTWAAAGLHREVIDGEVAGYWKRLRCGCLLVIEVRP